MIRLLAALMLLTLTACIEGREEIWISADGSGRLKTDYEIPASALGVFGGEKKVRSLIAGLLDEDSNVTSWTSSVTKSGRRAAIAIDLEFTDIRKLGDSITASDETASKLPPSVLNLLGDITISHSGRKFSVRREVRISKVLPTVKRFAPDSLTGRNLVQIIHLPLPASSSNATSVSPDGRTLTWDVPLAVAIDAPMISEFTAPIPIPRIVWIGIGSSMILLGILLVLWWLRRNRRSTPASLPQPFDHT